MRLDNFRIEEQYKDRFLPNSNNMGMSAQGWIVFDAKGSGINFSIDIPESSIEYQNIRDALMRIISEKLNAGWEKNVTQPE